MRARDATFPKFRFGRGVWRVLHFGPTYRCEPFVGKVLRVREYGVLEAIQEFDDGVGNGDVDVAFRVVPIDGKSTVLAARWVDGDVVILPECIGRLPSSKVIYSEGEGVR